VLLFLNNPNLNIFNNDIYFMNKCIALAKQAAAIGEVPVGALIVNKQREIISESYNLREKNQIATAHADLLNGGFKIALCM
jgi:tRNA(adenine34) deaminase